MHRTDKSTDTPQKYISPQVKVLSISTHTQILNSSIFGSLRNDPWDDGSSSSYGFGDDDE